MKVLFVFVLPGGGVDTLNRMRHKALRASGIEAHFLYFQLGSGSVHYTPDIPVYYESAPERIGALLQAQAFDAIVVTSFFLQLATFRALGFRGPLIFEIQGFGPQEQAKATIASAAPYLNAHADAFLYPETPHIDLLLKQLYPHIRRFSFPNPFDSNEFRYRPATPAIPYPVLAWIGRWEDNKNWADFMRIGAAAVAFSPGVGLWMFSDPALAQPGEAVKLVQLSEQLELTPRTTHVHNVHSSQMPYFYSMIGDSGGMLVMTSKTEGAPYAALEALSCRCPVLTTDSDGVRSAVVDGVTGLYYPHGDIQAAAEQVERLMKDLALRRKLIVGGVEHVRTRFTLNEYARNFANMLRELRS